jgi:hypothetical protein
LGLGFHMNNGAWKKCTHFDNSSRDECSYKVFETPKLK